jgi:hypothetical protein
MPAYEGHAAGFSTSSPPVFDDSKTSVPSISRFATRGRRYLPVLASTLSVGIPVTSDEHEVSKHDHHGEDNQFRDETGLRRPERTITMASVSRTSSTSCHS